VQITASTKSGFFVRSVASLECSTNFSAITEVCLARRHHCNFESVESRAEVCPTADSYRDAELQSVCATTARNTH
jgi:hypothetical protein